MDQPGLDVPMDGGGDPTRHFVIQVPPSCETSFGWAGLLVALSLGSLLFSTILHGTAHHMFGSLLQWFFMLPANVNVMTVYSFCNLHEIDWSVGYDKHRAAPPPPPPADAGEGKAEDEDESAAAVREVVKRDKEKALFASREQKDKAQTQLDFAAFRSVVLLLWVLTNMLYGRMVFLHMPSDCFLSALAYIVTALLVVHTMGALLFTLARSGRGLFLITCRAAGCVDKYSHVPTNTWSGSYRDGTRQAQSHYAFNAAGTEGGDSLLERGGGGGGGAGEWGGGGGGEAGARRNSFGSLNGDSPSGHSPNLVSAHDPASQHAGQELFVLVVCEKDARTRDAAVVGGAGRPRCVSRIVVFGSRAVVA
jgi:hypothetical protein